MNYFTFLITKICMELLLFQICIFFFFFLDKHELCDRKGFKNSYLVKFNWPTQASHWEISWMHVWWITHVKLFMHVVSAILAEVVLSLRLASLFETVHTCSQCILLLFKHLYLCSWKGILVTWLLINSI